jgi:hypothetical protein
MKTIHFFLLLTAVSALLLIAAPNTSIIKAKAAPTVDDIGAEANKELAAVRRATAKYHDIEQALEDGYVQATPCVEGEGIHYRRTDEFPDALLDCVFDPENPEILHYVPKPNGELQLIGVEYLVPKSCPGLATQPPEGFSGDADEWELEIGGTVWALNAFVWFGKPDNIFAFRDESITCN